MLKIIYTRPDGGVSIMSPALDNTIENSLRHVPEDATNVQIIDSSMVPTDRTFRNAWVAGDGKVEHDMEKCRDLQRDKIRIDRKPLLEQLDMEYLRALEVSDKAKQKEIADQKQVLRDATDNPAIDAATTPEELKEIKL